MRTFLGIWGRCKGSQWERKTKSIKYQPSEKSCFKYIDFSVRHSNVWTSESREVVPATTCHVKFVIVPDHYLCKCPYNSDLINSFTMCKTFCLFDLETRPKGHLINNALGVSYVKNNFFIIMIHLYHWLAVSEVALRLVFPSPKPVSLVAITPARIQRLGANQRELEIGTGPALSTPNLSQKLRKPKELD